MPIKIDRIDTEGSMQTLFIIQNGNEAQEIIVPTILADDFETKLNPMPDIAIEKARALKGKKIIKR